MKNVAAKKSEDTKAIAVKLEQAQMKAWIGNDLSADDVFKLLKLDDDVGKVLANPLLNSWVAYVERLKQNPYSILLGKLKTSKLANTDAKLVEMLMKAKMKTATSTIAGNLEAAQLDKWMKEGKTPAAVFKLLNLDDEGRLLFYRSSARAWVEYVNKLYAKNADEIILSVLKPFYTDTQLTRVVSSGRTVAKDMSETLEKILLNKWLSEKKSADDVFNFMLKVYHEQIFRTRDVDTWVSYVTKQDKENPYKTMWTVLQKHYSKNELEAMVYEAEGSSRTKKIGERLVEEMWLSELTSAKEVFNRLRLNQSPSLLFTSPELTTWTSYVAKLGPKKADEMMFSVLQPLYTKKEFANLLKAAKEVDETRTLLQGWRSSCC